MKRTLSAMALSLMLGAFTLTSAGAAANAAEEKKPESNAVKETQRAIDNLKSAVKDFENALEGASKDENLKRAIDNAQSALESAQKSMEHAKMFTEKYAPGRSDKDTEKDKGSSSPESSSPAPSDLIDGGTTVSGTSGNEWVCQPQSCRFSGGSRLANKNDFSVPSKFSVIYGGEF